MIRRGPTLGRGSIWETPEGPEQSDYPEETERFYDSPPPPRRMDVSVCCLPTAGSGAQHPPHAVSLPSGGQHTIQTSYQYADQIVPERGHPDGLTVLAAGQDAWQQVSSTSTVPNATTTTNTTTTTTTYIDYSWLQMQVRTVTDLSYRQCCQIMDEKVLVLCEK